MRAPRSRLFVAFSALLLAALGLAYWFYKQTLGYAPPPAQPLSQAQLNTARAELREAERQIKQAYHAAKAGQKPRLDLHLHEEAVNTLLNQDLTERLARSGVSEARVHIMPGNLVEAGAWVERDGRRVWVSGTVQLAADGDKLSVRPLEMRLGSLPMPEAFRRHLLDRYGLRLDALDLGLKGQRVSIQSSQGALRIATVK